MVGFPGEGCEGVEECEGERVKGRGEFGRGAEDGIFCGKIWVKGTWGSLPSSGGGEGVGDGWGVGKELLSSTGLMWVDLR